MVQQPDAAVPTGFETVAEALEAEDFPMDKQGLAYSVGDVELADLDAGVVVPVRALLDSIEQEVFASAEVALARLRAAFARLAGRPV